MANIRRIMVPIDFSDGADAAVREAMALASALGAEVHLLHVWQPPPYVVPEMVVTVPGGLSQTFDEFMRERTRRELEAFVKPHRTAKCNLVCHVETGTPKDVIVRFLEANPMDLVVMSTHGRTGLMHALMGSVAEHVVRNGLCPVMTVRFKEPHGRPSESGQKVDHAEGT